MTEAKETALSLYEQALRLEDNPYQVLTVILALLHNVRTREWTMNEQADLDKASDAIGDLFKEIPDRWPNVETPERLQVKADDMKYALNQMCGYVAIQSNTAKRTPLVKPDHIHDYMITGMERVITNNMEGIKLTLPDIAAFMRVVLLCFGYVEHAELTPEKRQTASELYDELILFCEKLKEE